MRKAAILLLFAMLFLAGCLPPGAEGISITIERSPTAPLPTPQVVFLVTESPLPPPTQPAFTATALPPSATPQPTLTLPPTMSPQQLAQTPWAPCAGVYLSRLRAGMLAYVSQDPPLSNNLRAGPTTFDEVLGVLSPGTELALVAGPVCSEGWIWWQVVVNDSGMAGWTVEGDSEAYWLVPCSPDGMCWVFATPAAP